MRQFRIANPSAWLGAGFGFRIGRTATFIFMLAALVVPLLAQAQQPKVPRVGIVFVAAPSTYTHRMAAFRQGLRELGWAEGNNIFIEDRYAEGKLDHQPSLILDLVRRGVDVIVTSGQTLTQFAKNATSTIPIVMANDGDPVGNKFVASLARPGGNITGLSNFSAEMCGKRLELLTEIVPGAARVTVLGTSTEPGNAQSLNATEQAARSLRVQLQYLDISASRDIETALRAAAKGHTDALLVLSTAIFISQRKLMAGLVAKHRLTAMYPQSEYVYDGGLVSYGPNAPDLFRRAATYVDKILKGAKPADLPVEQPTKFELVINLKTAKALGLTIPQSILVRADEVIQ